MAVGFSHAGVFMSRFSAEEKRLLNCSQVDVNQLMPIKYHWAWEHYLNGCANHWMPSEVPMNRDIEQWRGGKLTNDEKLLIKRNLGFFATAESLVANNVVLAIFRRITNAECRQYLLRQAFEEAIHTHTFLYVVESLNLVEGEIFNMYREIPAVKQKDLFVMNNIDFLLYHKHDVLTVQGIQELVKNLVAFYVIMEGIFFYSGFAMVLSLHRRNLMTGIGEQFQYILRDETVHLNFGIDLINGIKQENTDIWTEEFKASLIADVKTATDLEILYAKECLPNGVLGLNADMFVQYVHYIANRRLERIGLPKQFDVEKSPFDWMSEVIDLPKEKNFFESRVTDYQSTTLKWD